MKTYILLFPIVFSFFCLNAQDYTPLECQGEIPKEITTSSSKKYEREIERIQQNDYKQRERKSRKQFALETNFVIDELLQSGLVLFNDPVTKYLEKVMQILLVNESGKLKKKIKIYTLRSPSVNAFATERGNIFVTLGLLAQLENEAQLAFILAHELVHVKEKHALELFLEVKDLDRNASEDRFLKKATFDQKLITKNRYSKEKESEADDKGLELFLKTDYDVKTVGTVFDVLKYAYLPFDDISFPKSFFEDEHYVFPDVYYLSQVKPIAGIDEDEDDTKSTHPNIGARRTAFLETINAINRPENNQFLVSKSEFLDVQTIARKEIPLLHLKDEQFADAIYTAFMLLEKDTESLYLKKIIAKSLYVYAKYKSEINYPYGPDYKEVEGASQRVHFLLDTMSANELTVLATRYTWNYPKIIQKIKNFL